MTKVINTNENNIKQFSQLTNIKQKEKILIKMEYTYMNSRKM
jgi:hypothetical protein